MSKRKSIMEPCGHRVLILPQEVEEKSAGGIIMHNNDMQKQLERAGNDIGTIYKLGKNAWKAYDDGLPWAKEGDTVIYAKYGGIFVIDPATDIQYILLNDSDIALVIEIDADD